MSKHVHYIPEGDEIVCGAQGVDSAFVTRSVYRVTCGRCKRLPVYQSRLWWDNFLYRRFANKRRRWSDMEDDAIREVSHLIRLHRIHMLRKMKLLRRENFALVSYYNREKARYEKITKDYRAKAYCDLAKQLDRTYDAVVVRSNILRKQQTEV